jgi:uncharacterized protein (DUF2252 family)
MTARPETVRAVLLICLTPLLLLAAAVGGCDAEPTRGAAGTPKVDPAKADATPAAATRPAGTTTPYDLLDRYYAPYTAADDPLGFPMKVRNLSAGPYRFWRGSKELFYEWCRTNAADWLADQPSYLRIHGDLHPGNLGIYLSQGEFGQHVAFGAVDFDESARLPFQLELLQGVVTLKLLSDHRRIRVDAQKLDTVIATMLEAYRTSLDSDRTPTQLLEDDKWVGALLKDVRKREYSKEVDKYVHKGHFETVIEDKSDRTKEILQPAKGKGEIADAIESALTKTPDGADLFRTAGVSKKSILDIARRTQLESAGSEGLHKYLVLLANKSSSGKRLILYLKQQIPTAAERVGIIPTDSRPPGQRAAEDAHDLSRPPGYFNGWCPLNGGSYRLTIKEPWSETLDGKDVDTFDDLKHFARIWGTVAGSLHRQGRDVVERVKSRLTPELAKLLRDRGGTYAAAIAPQFQSFATDARTRAAIERANAALRDLEKNGR